MNSSALAASHPANNYYDLDAILADQQFVPCTFLHHVQGLGYLTGSEDQDDIVPGTKLNLPIWFTESLVSEGQHLVEVEMPRIFSDPVLRSLDASAPSVDLYTLSPYYFRFAERFIALADPSISAELSSMLTEAFRQRLIPLMEHTQTREHSSDYIQGLDTTERDILKRGQVAAEQIKKWQARDPIRMKQAASLNDIK